MAKKLLGDMRATFQEKGTALVLPSGTTTMAKAASDGIVAFDEGEELENFTAAVRLADRADGWFDVREAKSGATLSFRMRGHRAIPAQLAEGYLVYPESLNGATLLARPSRHGVEDYVYFPKAPSMAKVEYDLKLSKQVAGLRLVANSLEAVDANGNPVLRVASPYLVDAAKKRVDARLQLKGCAADTDPAMPWGRAPTAPGADQCQVVVGWESASLRYPALLDPSWTTTGSMATARSVHTATKLDDGKVLVAGGMTTFGSLVNTAEVYNPSTSTWSATNALVTARYSHTATLLSDGKVLVVGGFSTSGGTVTSTVEIYSPSSGKWSSATNLISARAGHAAIRINSGSVVVTGGMNGSSTVNNAEIYNPSSNSWSLGLSSSRFGRAHHTVDLLSDGRLLLIGGQNGSAAALSSSVLYNVSSSTTTLGANLSVARSHHTATKLNDGRYLVAGGRKGLIAIPATEIYDVTANTSKRSANLIGERYSHTATLLSEGTVLVVGGQGKSVAEYRTELFNPTNQTWTELQTLGDGFVNHTATLLSTGKVLIAGGNRSGSSFYTASYLYDSAGTAIARVATTSAEYKYTAKVYSEILSDRSTELWARVYRPSTLASGTRYPVIMILHGNHATCGTGSNPRVDNNSDYTTTGGCPSGYVVAPSHNGFAYIADELAARGYIVVSINANRGINSAASSSDPTDDPSLIAARGKLILRHLQLLSEWDRGVSTTHSSLGISLRDKLDLTQVGLMGHSRGGEGARAALAEFRKSGSIWPSRITGLSIRSIFEIAPSDNDRFEAFGVKWGVLFGSCDMDGAYPQGPYPFDRMLLSTSDSPSPSFKALYYVWGANHNFYNSEWQQSDSAGCSSNTRALFTQTDTGSAEQRQTAFYPAVRFFTATVGASANQQLARLFDPAYAKDTLHRVPLEPRVDRGYSSSPSSSYAKLLEDFTDTSGGVNVYGPAQYWGNVSVRTDDGYPYYSPELTYADISWSSTYFPSSFFQTHWTEVGSGFDLRNYTYLEFRVDAKSSTNTTTSFSVQLVQSNDSLSGAVDSSQYVTLTPNSGGISLNAADGGKPRTAFQTVRVPLSAFSGATLSSVRGVRFAFNKSSSGQIQLAQIKATKSVSGQ